MSASRTAAPGSAWARRPSSRRWRSCAAGAWARTWVVSRNLDDGIWNLESRDWNLTPGVTALREVGISPSLVSERGPIPRQSSGEATPTLVSVLRLREAQVARVIATGIQIPDSRFQIPLE